MLTLYFSPGSSAMATHIALHEIGVPFETKLVSFQRRAARVRVPDGQPRGQGPDPDDRRPAADRGRRDALLSRQAYPEAKLWPRGRHRGRGAGDFVDVVYRGDGSPGRRIGLERWKEVFKIADPRLGRNEWAVGGRYSIADIHLFRLYWRFKTATHRLRRIPEPRRPFRRMMARPAVKKTIEIESKVGYQLP